MVSQLFQYLCSTMDFIVWVFKGFSLSNQYSLKFLQLQWAVINQRLSISSMTLKVGVEDREIILDNPNSFNLEPFRRNIMAA